MKLDALTYGDLVAFMSDYPSDASMLLDHLADDDWTGDFHIAPNSVGQALDHARSMPEDGIPLVITTSGPSRIVGIFFAIESPILILAPE